MEEDFQTEKTTKSSPILMAIGVMGFGFGLTAIALSISAMVKVGSISSAMNEKIEKAATLALDIKKINDRFDALAAEVENLKNNDNSRVDNLQKQFASTVEKIGTILSENRTNIEENRKAIEELSKRPVGKSRPKASETTQAQTDASAAAEVSSTNDTPSYKIQAGDTFGKIAKRFGLSISAIKAANPNVESTRLQIGQVINLPVKK